MSFLAADLQRLVAAVTDGSAAGTLQAIAAAQAVERDRQSEAAAAAAGALVAAAVAAPVPKGEVQANGHTDAAAGRAVDKLEVPAQHAMQRDGRLQHSSDRIPPESLASGCRWCLFCV